MSSLHEIPVTAIDGTAQTLEPWRGQVLLIVNVASQCGFTPQYAGLEALHRAHAAQGFAVLGFPCNQFGAQEPGTPEQIEEFCSTNFGVQFPMMEKIDVKGEGQHDIYAILSKVPDADGQAGEVMWNFEKFLVSADATRTVRFRPQTVPDDPTVIAAIEAALPA